MLVAQKHHTHSDAGPLVRDAFGSDSNPNQCIFCPHRARIQLRSSWDPIRLEETKFLQRTPLLEVAVLQDSAWRLILTPVQADGVAPRQAMDAWDNKQVVC